jgi:hypothetical protein
MVKNAASLTVELLVDRYPRLYHMAEAGSWASIEKYGLLSTTALLDLFEIEGSMRDEIETKKRPKSVEIRHPLHGYAWIRDNKPINETVLRRTLVGMSEADWYRTLNSRVFFWLSESRLARLRNAPPYRNRPHDILVVDTGRLLKHHEPSVELAHLNTGAVHPSATYPRGTGTFRRIVEYPWRDRLRVAPNEPIVELTVLHSVPRAAEVVIDVQESI